MSDKLEIQLKQIFEEEVDLRSFKPFTKPLPRKNPVQPLFLYLGRAGLVAAVSFLMWGCFHFRQPSELDLYLQNQVKVPEIHALLNQSAEIVQSMLLK